MIHLITFLEGLVTFISPCVLPMLPVYISYFAGDSREGGAARALFHALGFVLGFTLVFVALGVFAGSVGYVLRQYQTLLNLVGGILIIGFGLSFLGLFHIPFFRGPRAKTRRGAPGFLSALAFGLIFAVGWSPCVGAFLGSALMLAAGRASAFQGATLLLCYSLGLGVPFLICALLVQSLKDAFAWIKAHYRVINTISGLMLVAMGLLMATGLLGQLLALVTWEPLFYS